MGDQPSLMAAVQCNPGQARLHAQPHTSLAATGMHNNMMMGEHKQEMCRADALGCSPLHPCSVSPRVRDTPLQACPTTGVATPQSNEHQGICDSVHISECINNNDALRNTLQPELATRTTHSRWPAPQERGCSATGKTDGNPQRAEAMRRSHTCHRLPTRFSSEDFNTTDDHEDTNHEEAFASDRDEFDHYVQNKDGHRPPFGAKRVVLVPSCSQS